jgi:hypothetical protein
MRRLTVTVDEALVRVARADVAAGRADSISAWVADAMRAKAQARAELVADLEELNRSEPPSDDVLDTIARSIQRPRTWVVQALGLSRARVRRTG